VAGGHRPCSFEHPLPAPTSIVNTKKYSVNQLHYYFDFNFTKTGGWGFAEVQRCNIGAHPIPKQVPLAK
jgi:hypothetical protein